MVSGLWGMGRRRRSVQICLWEMLALFIVAIVESCRCMSFFFKFSLKSFSIFFSFVTHTIKEKAARRREGAGIETTVFSVLV